MSDEKRKVPTGPGWWWYDEDGVEGVVSVWRDPRGLRFRARGWAGIFSVDDPGLVAPEGAYPEVRFIAPVLTPAEADALRERAERAEASAALWSESSDAATLRWHDENVRHGETARERDRYREAVGRLRALCCEFAATLTSDDEFDALHAKHVEVMAATTDDALAGPDAPPATCCVCGRTIDTREVSDGGGWDGAQRRDGRWVCSVGCDEAADAPPAPDAGLLAKANAALVAELEDRPTWSDVVDTAEATADAADRRIAALAEEVAELRAELAAERGGPEGAVSDLWRPGFEYEGVVTWTLTTSGYGDLELRGPRGWYLTTTKAHDLSDEAEAALDALGIMNEQPYARPMMRATEAEARRLGLLGEVER